MNICELPLSEFVTSFRMSNRLLYSFIPIVLIMFAESDEVMTSLTSGTKSAIGTAAMQRTGLNILYRVFIVLLLLFELFFDVKR